MVDKNLIIRESIIGTDDNEYDKNKITVIDKFNFTARVGISIY